MRELTKEELEKMHDKLRDAFQRASDGYDIWRKRSWHGDSRYDDDGIRDVNINSSISALANSAQALLAVDRELRERDERENGIKRRSAL